MGRKGLYAEKPKKGPGRKSKKQGPPELTRGFKGNFEFIALTQRLCRTSEFNRQMPACPINFFKN